MIGRLNHIAIVVPDLDRAAAVYRDALGARVSPPQPLPAHGVTVVFVELPNTKIELLQPLGADSPVRGFLDKNPGGGMHHLCYEVDDIIVARDRPRTQRPRALRERASPRRARHAPAVPPSQGVLRHAVCDRTGATR